MIPDRHPSRDAHDTPPHLRLFTGLDAAARDEIVMSATRYRKARGQRLFRQGSLARFFYILQEGTVKLTQLTPDGHLVLLRLVVPGEALGGVAALVNRTYPVSAEAASDCVALAWNGRTMDGLLRRYPQLAINLIDLLAERVHDMQSRYEELATEQVEQRLAHTLLRLARKTGRRVDAGVLLDVRLSRQDLAEMTGTSLFTVSRVLNRWQKAEVIQSRRQRILVRNQSALAGLADGLAGHSSTFRPSLGQIP